MVASLASLSVNSFPLCPAWAFTHVNSRYQFYFSKTVVVKFVMQNDGDLVTVILLDMWCLVSGKTVHIYLLVTRPPLVGKEDEWAPEPVPIKEKSEKLKSIRSCWNLTTVLPPSNA